MHNTANAAASAKRNVLLSRRVACVAALMVLLIGPSIALADDASWIGSISEPDPAFEVQSPHNDFAPFKGSFTVTVTNSGTVPWGDFHFRVFDPMGGQDISNVSFLDASMGGYDPTSSQAGLRWTIDNVVVGAQMSLYFCTDPVMPGETATFVVYTSNQDHLAFFGVAFYPSPVPPIGACCAPDYACVLTCQYDCAAPGIWHGELTSCIPNSCPRSLGACCDAPGNCTITTEFCVGNWTIGGSCEPNPCPPLPTESRTWGAIKNTYR